MEEKIDKNEISGSKVFFVQWWFIFPILVSFTILLSCRSEVSSPVEEDRYLFIEILRNTNGKALSEKSASVHIDFGQYSFDSRDGTLRVLGPNNNFHEFITLDSIKFVVAHDRTISGDLGGGHAGSVYAVNDFPYKTVIVASPLPYKDSIKINEYNEKGDITFELKENKVIINVNSEWRYTQEYDIDFNLGSFKIKDEIVIKNHGWQKKEKIIF